MSLYVRLLNTRAKADLIAGVNACEVKMNGGGLVSIVLTDKDIIDLYHQVNRNAPDSMVYPENREKVS